MDVNGLRDKAWSLRKRVMEVGYRTQSGHLSSALSCTDIMTALFYGGYVDMQADSPGRKVNHFILSKGHACIIQYLILNEFGYIDGEELEKCCHPGGILGAHPDCLKIDGIETTTGALGHGLSMAVGFAIAERYKGSNVHTYMVLGDGECEEGSVWEAALCAGHHGLDNLTVIVDYNKLQASDYTANITTLDPLKEKWEAFGFCAIEIDGHDTEEILSALDQTVSKQPKAVIAHTVKGKGVSMMENQNGWHGRKPNDREWATIKEQMGM